jgi:hypothetical protein
MGLGLWLPRVTAIMLRLRRIENHRAKVIGRAALPHLVRGKMRAETYACCCQLEGASRRCTSTTRVPILPTIDLAIYHGDILPSPSIGGRAKAASSRSQLALYMYTCSTVAMACIRA